MPPGAPAIAEKISSVRTVTVSGLSSLGREGEHVTMAQGLGGGELLAIEPGAVLAAEVGEHILAAVSADLSMVAGDAVVGNDQGVVGGAANRRHALPQRPATLP